MAIMSESLPLVLNLWKQELGTIPDYVWERTELEALILADNSLTEVSDQIGRLTRLRMLDLGHNQLTRIPESLGDMAGLTDFLYLHDNQLSSLPSSIEQLKKTPLSEPQRKRLRKFP